MPHQIVIFGASGDLTSRKLIPALYQLFRKGRLPEQTSIVGFSRTEFSHEKWRDSLAKSTAKFAGSAFDRESWSRFAPAIFYYAGDLSETQVFGPLGKFLDGLPGGPSSTRIYYLATAPQFYEPAVEHLGAAGLADESHGVRRVVIEKPFGADLPSAKRLNEAVHHVFAERQVYRIDHYLGKETVQNLLVFRFANTVFEPVWNRNYIDHVQITAAEEVAVGRRAGYYDTAGVMRDMFQNHLLQLLTITAMEAPARSSSEAVRNEKVKVLQSIRPLEAAELPEDTVRGQYRGYLKEPDVAAGSQTATFAALRLHIDNWRWQGVPFYLRSGKVMSCRTTQIVIQFREPPHMMFANCKTCPYEGNRLVIQIQPAEGIQLHFQSKVPDAGMQFRLTDLDFRFDERYQEMLPEAYERLLLDTLTGDPSLFARGDEVELAWGIIDPILKGWQQSGKPQLYPYEPGLWGPEESATWIRAQGREWFDTCPVLKYRSGEN